MRPIGRACLSLQENIVMLRDLALRSLRDGETVESIARQARQLLSTRFGDRVGAMDLEETVLGYATWFRKKGLI